MPVHLRPSAPTAPDALLCGDPGRALAIAQAVLVKPRMSNHHRGLWGYYGRTERDRELTVQATGIGGPSAVAVLGELAELGLRRAVRVGTCSATGPAPPAGAGLVVAEARAADGASVSLGLVAGAPIHPDPLLITALRRATGCATITVVSRDVPLDRGVRAGARGAQVEDLQTAATFARCHRAGIAAGAVLAVASSAGRRLEDEPLEAALLGLARGAARALEGP